MIIKGFPALLQVKSIRRALDLADAPAIEVPRAAMFFAA